MRTDSLLVLVRLYILTQIPPQRGGSEKSAVTEKSQVSLPQQHPLLVQQVPSSIPCYAVRFFSSEELYHGMYGTGSTQPRVDNW